MSLKFGIYLVEQRIISPEQFCGLVKIQQESGTSLATVAIRKNLLTIKQVAHVLDQLEMSPSKSFVQLAIESDYLDRHDAEVLIAEQQQSNPTIRRLVVECGLLTEKQTNVLFEHYQRIGTRPIQRPLPKQSVPTQPSVGPSHPMDPTGPRPPKFKQRPVIVSQYTSPASG